MDEHDRNVDVDRIGRMAAAHIRAEGRTIADTETALQQVLGADAVDAPTPLAAVHVAPAASDRPRWKLLAVAAVIGLFAFGLGWALINGAGGSIDLVAPTGTGQGVPAATTPTTPAATSAPSPGSTSPTSGPATPTSTADSTTTAAPTTEPPTTAPPVTPPSGTPFAGFRIEAPSLAPPDDLPYLLPQPAPPAERTYRGGYDGDAEAPLTLSQLWVRTAPDGKVEAVLHLGTRIAPTFEQPNGQPIDVARWTSARSYEAVDGIVILELSAPEGLVDVWASGLGEDDVTALAGELVGGETGWTAPVLTSPDWVLVDATWNHFPAIRGTTTLDAEGDVDSSIDVMRGMSVFDAGGVVQLDAQLELVDVDGTPALLRRDSVAALAFVRDDGTIVRLGSRDPSADLVTVARSLTEVDSATWDAATRPWPDGADGCIGLFC